MVNYNIAPSSIHVYYFWNEEQAVLKDGFEASFKDEYPLVPLKLETRILTSNFGTSDFKRIIREKVYRIIHEVIVDNWGQYVIVSDIDIVFYGKINTIIDDFVDEKYSIVFQKENRQKGINTGFVLMKCDKKVSEIWEAVLDTLDSSPEHEFINEQAAMVTMFRENPPEKVKWGLFPDEIWAFSNDPMPPNIILHHANCTAPHSNKTSLELKLEQFKEVRQKITGTRVVGRA
jgi:hypothetical protein